MLTNRLSASRRIYITVMRVLLVLAAVLTAALVVFMIVYVLSKGLPYVTWHLLSTKPSYVSGTIGILPDICNTVQILLASLLIVLPLGVGRAIGEAMAVMMVSGNAPNMPSLFESVRFLTTAVASEMSYASGLQRQALFSIALVLYVFIMLINAALNFFLKRRKE